MRCPARKGGAATKGHRNLSCAFWWPFGRKGTGSYDDAKKDLEHRIHSNCRSGRALRGISDGLAPSRLPLLHCHLGQYEAHLRRGRPAVRQEVSPSNIKVGDPVTFILNEELDVATHRVVRIDTENSRLYTKGDANEIEDSDPVHFNNVIGVPQFSVPKLGYVSDFVQNPPGMYITIGVGIILILAVFLPDMIGKKKKEDEDASAVRTESESTTEENERLKAEIERLKSETPHYSSGELAQLASQKECDKSK